MKKEIAKVPFVDLPAAYREIAGEVEPKLREMMSHAQFIGGAEVAAFEEEFAAYCGTSYCVGVASGTSALTLILRAMEIGSGDEVVVPANTFAATAKAVCLVGAHPVFVDVTADSLTMDPESFEQAIGPDTRAVIPVHLYGQPADMDPILAIARRHGLMVVEDAAQAHGARYKTRRAGSLGDAAAFSFYPSKNLGAFGDAGAVVSDDAELVEHIRMLKEYGQREKYVHRIVGENARLDAIQAAVLRIKLAGLDAHNQARRRIAAVYAEHLSSESGWLDLPIQAVDREHIWHLYVVHLDDREALKEALEAQDIGVGLHYPYPLHHQDAFKPTMRVQGPLTVSERSAARLLSLPMHPYMTEAQIGFVIEAVRSFRQGRA